MISYLPDSGAPLPHYVSTAPFDAHSVEAMTDEQNRVYKASQLRLMWWKFREHKLALASGIFLLCLYSSCWRPIICIPAMSTSSIRRRSPYICSTRGNSSGRSSMAGR